MHNKIQLVKKECDWINQSVDFKINSEDSISVTAGKNTDLYNSADGDEISTTAPILLFKPDKDFVFTAAINIEFKNKFDAGNLILFEDKNQNNFIIGKIKWIQTKVQLKMRCTKRFTI